MTPPEVNSPILRAGGQPCASCGSALAADQRYCLECGARQGAPRLDPLAHARGYRAAAEPLAQAPGAGPRGWETLPPAALAIGRPRVAALAASGILIFGALIGATTSPTPESVAAGPLYLAGTAPTATTPAAPS